MRFRKITPPPLTPSLRPAFRARCFRLIPCSRSISSSTAPFGRQAFSADAHSASDLAQKKTGWRLPPRTPLRYCFSSPASPYGIPRTHHVVVLVLQDMAVEHIPE